LITISVGEVVVVVEGGGGAAVVRTTVVGGAGPGSVPVVVLNAGGGPLPGAKCERAWLDAPKALRATLGWARDPMAAVCSARRRARPILWAAVAAAQIVTTGLTVATALTAKATMRVRAPESTW
jgi:hypothetical protein